MIRYEHERWGGDTNYRDREAFNNMIAGLGLIEIPITDRRFTWSNIRENLSLAKLDKVLVSTEWESKFNLSLCETLPRSTSDHVPICLHLGGIGEP